MKVRVALVLALILAVLLLTPRAAAVRFAKELIQLNVDLIVAVASRATRAVTQETKAIPIVMVDVGDPVAFGFVSNLARPEGNVTGLSAAANEVAAKGLQLLKELAPRATRVVVLMPQIAMPTPTGGVPTRELDAAAPGLGLSLETQFVREPSDFGAAFAAIGQKHPDGMFGDSRSFLVQPPRQDHRIRSEEPAADRLWSARVCT